MFDSVPHQLPNHLPLQEIVERISQTGQFRFNPGVSLEWWYITGFLWNEEDCEGFGTKAFVNEISPRLGFQTTYFSGTGDAKQEIFEKRNTDTTGSGKFLGLVAHAAFSKLDKKIHRSSTRYAKLPASASGHFQPPGNRSFSNFASVSPDVFHVNIADWKLTQIARRPVQFIASQTVENLRLNYLAQAVTLESENRTEQQAQALWLQGQNGIAEKLSGNKNAYISIPFLRVSAHLTEDLNSTASQTSTSKSAEQVFGARSSTQKSQTMCGTAWLDHESGVALSKESGWVWLSLKTPDHRAFMIYRLSDKQGQTKDFVAYRDPMGKQFSGSIKNWSEAENACLGDPKICYPQKLTFDVAFQDTGKHHFIIESFFENQEVEGPDFQIHSRYWEGAIRFEYTSESGTGKGLGFMEIVKP